MFYYLLHLQMIWKNIKEVITGCYHRSLQYSASLLKQPFQKPQEIITMVQSRHLVDITSIAMAFFPSCRRTFSTFISSIGIS